VLLQPLRAEYFGPQWLVACAPALRPRQRIEPVGEITIEVQRLPCEWWSIACERPGKWPSVTVICLWPPGQSESEIIRSEPTIAMPSPGVKLPPNVLRSEATFEGKRNFPRIGELGQPRALEPFELGSVGRLGVPWLTLPAQVLSGRGHFHLPSARSWADPERA
jgi:hypothetical protein